MRKLLFVLVVVLVVGPVIMAAVPARGLAQTITWTSTADFDAGTKSRTADSLAGSWTISTNLPTRVSDPGGFTLGTKFYVVGGFGSAGAGSPVTATQVYDTVSSTWSAGTNMGTAEWGAPVAYCACTGKAYVFAGFTGATYSAFRTTQIYDPTADAWSNAAAQVPLAVAYEGQTAITVGSLVYVFNGTNAQQYDPAGDSWTALAAAPNRGLWREAVALAGSIYLIGGSSAPMNFVDAYDIAGNSWTTGYDTVPFGHYGGLRDGPATGDGSTFYVGYGNDNVDFFAHLYVYAPATKTWTQRHEGAIPRDGVAAGAVSGTLYVAGGRNGGNPSGSLVGTDYFEVFRPTGTMYAGYDVETSTDNPSVSSGLFSLGNNYGDTFAFARPDSLTYKWTTKQALANNVHLGNGWVRNMTRGFEEIRNEFADGSGTEYASIDGTIPLKTSSDLDVRIQISNSGVAGFPLAEFQLIDIQGAGWNAAPAGQGNGILLQLTDSTTTNVQVSAFKIVSHGATAIGLTTSTNTGSPYLRIALASGTNTWSIYWSVDGTAWNLVGSSAVAIAGPVYPIANALSRSAGTPLPYWTYDNFYVATGTFNSAPWRTSGTWTSPLQTYAQQIVQQVTVDYSGATAADVISSLSIVDAAGAVIAQDDSPISSGSSFTWNVPFVSTMRQDWSVKVALSGDGSGSVSVLDVIVQTASPPGGSGGAPTYSVSCSFNPLLITWTCRDFTDYTLFPFVNRTLWYYDGAYVGQAVPDGQISFRAVNGTWASNPGTRTIRVVAWGVGPLPPYDLIVYESEALAWVVVAVLVAVVIGAALHFRQQDAARGVYFPPVSNPSYRRSATSVEEYPKGWRSYRQRDPDQYTRLRSVRRRDLWIVYGIRPSTPAEHERTGRKYIAEVQAVREKM